MRRLALAAVAALALALTAPASASAQKFDDKVSLHKTYFEDRFFGLVQSAKPKCEPNREINLYRDDGKGFSFFAAVMTDSLGEYEFENLKPTNPKDAAKRGAPPFPPGEYFVRVLRKKSGDDICKRDDSPIKTIEDNS